MEKRLSGLLLLSTLGSLGKLYFFPVFRLCLNNYLCISLHCPEPCQLFNGLARQRPVPVPIERTFPAKDLTSYTLRLSMARMKATILVSLGAEGVGEVKREGSLLRGYGAGCC